MIYLANIEHWARNAQPEVWTLRVGSAACRLMAQFIIRISTVPKHPRTTKLVHIVHQRRNSGLRLLGEGVRFQGRPLALLQALNAPPPLARSSKASLGLLSRPGQQPWPRRREAAAFSASSRSATLHACCANTTHLTWGETGVHQTEGRRGKRAVCSRDTRFWAPLRTPRVHQ